MMYKCTCTVHAGLVNCQVLVSHIKGNVNGPNFSLGRKVSQMDEIKACKWEFYRVAKLVQAVFKDKSHSGLLMYMYM